MLQIFSLISIFTLTISQQNSTEPTLEPTNSPTFLYTCPSDLDFFGNDLDDFDKIDIWQECSQKCLNDPECSSWTYLFKYDSCWLKKGIPGLVEQSHGLKVKSGYNDCIFEIPDPPEPIIPLCYRLEGILYGVGLYDYYCIHYTTNYGNILEVDENGKFQIPLTGELPDLELYWVKEYNGGCPSDAIDKVLKCEERVIKTDTILKEWWFWVILGCSLLFIILISYLICIKYQNISIGDGEVVVHI
jgi:hypothetical protein